MATVRLINLVKPREANSPNTLPSSDIDRGKATYTDLALDLTLSKSVGVGLTPTVAKDIIVSEDVQAIRNSLYNIFSTKRGEMLLNPDFGASMEQFLFENVSPFIGKIIGEKMLSAIQKYEPRVEVININVYPQADLNQYLIQFIFSFTNIKKESTLTLFLQKNGQIVI